MAGILGEDGPDPNPPPPNQGVLDYVQAQQAAFQPNYPGEVFAGSQGPYVDAALNGMSGYFDVDPYRGIMPHQFTAREVAAQSGEPLGQLAGSLLPHGNVSSAEGLSYGIPNDDKGGFFNIGQMYQGAGMGAPSVMQATMGQGLSTNNWRLLGRGPGWVMRNGFLIDTNSPRVRAGFPTIGANPSGTAAENLGAYEPRIALGTGAHYGVPGFYQYTGQAGWPGADQWIQAFNPSQYM